MNLVQEHHTQSIGPGTHLHRLLAAFGFEPSVECNCEVRTAEMDRQGPQWCRDNLDVIVDWLVEEARQRQCLGMFARIAPGTAIATARRLVWQAIVLAEGGLS